MKGNGLLVSVEKTRFVDYEYLGKESNEHL